MRFYLLCSLKRIPKLSTIRTLRVVVYCKWILNYSCWQSCLLLRVAKSHCFITNLIMLNHLFKPQFKESLTNEFLALFFFLNKCKFLRDILIAEGKKIIRVNTRRVRDIVIHLVLSLIRREENRCLLAGFAAACWQRDMGSGDSRLSHGSASPGYKPWPQISSHSVLPHLLSTLASLSVSSRYWKFHEYKKFHWLPCDPTQR